MNATITYTVYFNAVPDRSRNYRQNFVLWYEFLNEEDVRREAANFQIKKARIEKLVHHPSKLFSELRNSRCRIVKIFHASPVDFRSAHQQFKARINEQLAEWEKEQQNTI